MQSRRKKALESYVTAGLLVAGGPMKEALLYRWKGIEEADAFADRAQRCKQLLVRSLRVLYSAKAVKDAEAQVIAM